MSFRRRTHIAFLADLVPGMPCAPTETASGCSDARRGHQPRVRGARGEAQRLWGTQEIAGQWDTERAVCIRQCSRTGMYRGIAAFDAYIRFSTLLPCIVLPLGSGDSHGGVNLQEQCHSFEHERRNEEATDLRPHRAGGETP